VRGCRIDVKTVCLKTGEVHRLGGATRHDQELFRRETLLYLLTNVVAYAWVVLIWNIDLTFDEVEPCPNNITTPLTFFIYTCSTFTFFAYPSEIRKAIYATKAIKSLKMENTLIDQKRKVFPTEMLCVT
jgi:hypothetical protein